MFIRSVFQVNLFSSNMFRADVNTTLVIYHLLEYITTDIDLLKINIFWS